MSIFHKLDGDNICSKMSGHPIFNKINCAIDYQIDRIHLSHQAKENMIHAFLKLYFNEFKEAIYDYLESDGSGDPMAFISMYTATLTKINQESLAHGIPEIFLNRYGLLQKKQVESVYITFENVLSSQFYSQPEDKLVAMLDMLLCHLVWIILDSEKTLNELNGQMELALSGSIFE